MLNLQFFVSFVAAIRPTIRPVRTAMTIVPRTRFSTGTRPSKTAIPARIAIAPETSSNVLPILSTFLLPLISFVAAMRPTIMPANAAIIIVPLVSTSGLTMPSITAVPAIIAIAPETASKLFPIASTFLLPEISFVARIRPTIILANAATARPPLIRSPVSIPHSILTTKPMMPIAAAILSITPPILSTFSAFETSFVAAIRPTII